MILEYMGVEPSRAHQGDAGLDLYAQENALLHNGVSVLIDTATRVNIPDGYVGLLFGRSGLGAKHGVSPVNAVGVIDSGYTDSIKVALTKHTNGAYRVELGERIAQLVIVPIAIPTLKRVRAFDLTERGENGFGSSGEK